MCPSAILVCFASPLGKSLSRLGTENIFTGDINIWATGWFIKDLLNLCVNHFDVDDSPLLRVVENDRNSMSLYVCFTRLTYAKQSSYFPHEWLDIFTSFINLSTAMTKWYRARSMTSYDIHFQKYNDLKSMDVPAFGCLNRPTIWHIY